MFIGHHDAPSTLYKSIFDAIGKLIHEEGVSEFWSGGYGAFDRMGERAVREWKERGESLKLVLVLAYPPKSASAAYYAGYDETFLPELQGVPLRAAIARRNQMIAHQAGHVLTWVRHPFGGSYKALRAAQRAGAHIHDLTSS